MKLNGKAEFVIYAKLSKLYTDLLQAGRTFHCLVFFVEGSFISTSVVFHRGRGRGGGGVEREMLRTRVTNYVAKPCPGNASNASGTAEFI